MNAAVGDELAALAGALTAITVAVRVRGRDGGGAGSGIVWRADGAIVTNAHVAAAPHAEVVFADGRHVEAAVERRDERRDLALLRIPAAGLTAATPRDPATLRTGELVAAFGHPLGVPNALALGIVSGPVRGARGRFVRADVRLLPGNSGGPLADMQGRVVGINSMVAGPSALAVPADEVEIFLHERGQPAPLGIRLLPARLRDGAEAFVIAAVDPQSRAELAGILPGDVVRARDLRRAPALSALAILRGGVPLRVPLPPDEGRVAA
jgi:serine protease Do